MCSVRRNTNEMPWTKRGNTCQWNNSMDSALTTMIIGKACRGEDKRVASGIDLEGQAARHPSNRRQNWCLLASQT